MSATHTVIGNMYLSVISGIFALVSLSTIQPYLSLAASLIAIASGVYSFTKKSKKK